MYKLRRLHFIGIGGSGMSGIAQVLHNLDYDISGSDLSANAATRALEQSGARIAIGHDAANVEGAEAVVFSSAIAPDNPELLQARRLGLPVVPRAIMLNELLRLRQGIAVAGSHGKTTITSMIASILHEAGLDPTYVVGGLVRKFGSHAGLGKGEFIVVETDESDGSFLHLSPVIGVVSNIDADHLETYGQDLQRLKRAFVDFIEKLPFYGVAVLCHDDERLVAVSAMVSKRVLSYGLHAPAADFRARDIKTVAGQVEFTLEAPYGRQAAKLAALGHHNVSNSLAALAVAHEVGVQPDDAIAALAEFSGVGRRLEMHGPVAVNGSEVLLVDDYGHHPTEISATLEALRGAYPDRRLVLVYQPHRYSRTRNLFDELADALAAADLLLLTEIYAASENPIAAISSEALLHAIHLRGKETAFYVNDLGEVPDRLAALCEDGDVVVTMGAGSISTLPQLLKGGEAA